MATQISDSGGARTGSKASAGLPLLPPSLPIALLPFPPPSMRPPRPPPSDKCYKDTLET